MSFFSSVFHIKATDDGYIGLSIRSSERRSDKYLLRRDDIEPALNDDPTDDLWSGSSRFQIKRTPQAGYIKVKEGTKYIYYTCSRHEIEVLNAQLVGVCREVPYKDEEAEIGYWDKSVVDTQPSFDMDILVDRIREMMKLELQDHEPLHILTPVVEQKSIAPKEEPESPSLPNLSFDTFIPSGIGNTVTGEIQQQKGAESSDTTLEAVKALKELKNE